MAADASSASARARFTSIQCGQAPPEGSPERTDFDAMQAKVRSGLGASIWAMRAHNKLIYQTTFLCAFMSNPSAAVYQCWKH